MFVLLVLHSLLSSASLGQTIPEADRSSFVPDSEGDLYFLLDSSGSITYDEFSKVKQFIGDLLQPFKFGPQDVQASIVQISTNPTLEFPLNQYRSSKDVQKAIQKIRQRMGDTNTGKAIDYVKKNLYAEDFGSRADVPKVLVWVTDGLSTDDISGPMKLLKDMGASVFIISTTGRGNFQDLASEPNEKYLKYVDKDDLGIITKELRDSIIELIQAKRLHAQNITTTSFQLTWPRLLSKDTGHYVLEYAPVSDTGKKLRRNLHGDQTSLEITGLTANTTYTVTLYPESNIEYFQPQTIQVSTLQEAREERNMGAQDITTTSLRLTWSRLSGDTGVYVLEYSPLSDPRKKLQKATSVEETTAVLSALTPNTTYQVTLIPDSNNPNIQPETIHVSTLPDYVQARNLQILDITSTSFNATWSKLIGDTGRYFLDYSSLSYPRRKTRKTLYGEQTSVVVSGLTPNTTYQVTFIPESKLEASQSQTLSVSTLPDLIQARNLQVGNITSRSLHFAWSRLEGDTGHYTLHYASASQPDAMSKMSLYGESRAVIGDLRPNTTYQITFIPQSSLPSVQQQTIVLTTLPEHREIRNLQARDITSTGFLLTWSGLPGEDGHYILEYHPVSDPGMTQQKIVNRDVTSVVVSGLRAETTYQVTLTPEYSEDYASPEIIMVSTHSAPVQERHFRAINITARSFLLTWSRAPGDRGRYIVEYSPVLDPRGKLQKTLSMDVSSEMISNLSPNTTYLVSLIHESGAQYETIQVSTLIDPVIARNLHVQDRTSNSFQLSWSRLSGDTGRYVLEYAPLTDLSKTIQNVLYGFQNSVTFHNLTPDTVYQVTFGPDSIGQYTQKQNIRVSTLPDPVIARNLHVQDRTSNSFQLSWSRLSEDTGRYVLEYAPLTDLSKTIQNVLYGGQNSVTFHNLTPDTVYQVTFGPDSIGQYTQKQNIRVSTLPELNQKRSVYPRDITTSSFQLSWSRMPRDQGPYVMELVLVSDPRRKLRKILPHDQTSIIFSNLSPDTQYRATVYSEANIQHVPPQKVEVSTLEEQHFPAHILISDPSPHSFRVSWGPSPDSVAGYEIQYGPIASNTVRTLQVNSGVNSTILENLKSNTTYLVTVSAIFKSGGEKALSAIACTEHNETWVKYLHFKHLGDKSVQATWGSADGEVQGYRVRCRRQAGPSSVISVAPQTHSAHVTDLTEGTTNKICVMPIYKNGEGKNLCRKIQLQPGTSANGYSRI